MNRTTTSGLDRRVPDSGQPASNAATTTNAAVAGSSCGRQRMEFHHQEDCKADRERETRISSSLDPGNAENITQRLTFTKSILPPAPAATTTASNTSQSQVLLLDKRLQQEQKRKLLWSSSSDSASVSTLFFSLLPL